MGLATAPAASRGDHACCVYGSDAVQADFVARFARDAVARGDRLFYLGDRSDEAHVVAMLDAGGVDGKALLDSGGLAYLHSSQMGLEDGFDRERQLDGWRALIGQARNDGYGGLAALAEMTWAQTWKVDSHALIDYEATAHEVFESRELSALCQYDARCWGESVIPHVGHAHPIALAARLRLERNHEARLLKMGGDIDLANTEFLAGQLAELLATGDATADLSELEFIDVAACRLLRRASEGELGTGRLELHNPPAILTRVMKLCSLLDD